MSDKPDNLEAGHPYGLGGRRQPKAGMILSRAAVYLLLGVLVAAGYALLVAGLALAFNRTFMIDKPLVSGLLFFVLALAFYPLRSWFETRINRLFLRGDQVYPNQLSKASGELARAVELSEITGVLETTIEETLHPEQMILYRYDSLSEQYRAEAGRSGDTASDLRFTANSPLVQVLTGRKVALKLNLDDATVGDLQREQARLKLLGAQLFVPLLGRKRLLGWLALSGRSEEGEYTPKELEYLEDLGAQAALAIERAEMVSEMEKQVREMNVLNRVAQGVNITITLDDIFELIFAQTTQIIPADEFRLILRNSQEDELVQVFYIRGDERVGDQENLRLPVEQSLESEVVRQGRGMLTDDYTRECRQRGLLPLVSEITAWMAAPLNAGAESIGVITLALRESGVYYSSEQMRTLQAITDQAAGAIVKARLLAETDRRARQLKTLNDVTRQLTSTLDPERLLKNILESAVEILNCEAGSLLMLDDQTNELVFKVVLGPVASELEGQRMPADAGVVGRSYQSQEPVIVNDVRASKDWFAQTDETTGFATRSLLVVPLIVKDEIIGVIEAVNRKDGSNFNYDDQELLYAFASQAAVAIENARLYTLTDQALTARVEELSVMQRIDRELNTSLDVKRAMQITLEWAMRQSNASAGLVGFVGEGGIELAAWQGYGDEINPYEETLIPGGRIHLAEVIAQGRAALRVYPDDDQPGLLKDACSQVLIPIQREKDVIGLILLESTQEEVCSEEALQFLQRLGDHASIAVSNAQLYSAVEAANIAKSEFVSFVAHELKNPMTSIKGYTELLAARAVGPVNEAQANFLNVIRSNIDRMNTLVSDLNDLSKIEAGRMRLEYAALPLPEIVQEVERSTRRQIEEKGQELVLNIPDDLPPLWGDRTRLLQVVVNLVSNAHKYTEQGGKVIVGAMKSSNVWDAQGAAQVVHIWVQDTGIGIAPEDQGKIFQKFFRSEDPKSREVPGTGLGLNITRSLVEMQGGHIWFESEFRKGTVFHFTVPVAEQ